MSIIGWIVVGLIAGVLARMATGTERRGCLGTLLVGILGAFIGGALFSLARGGDTDVVDDFDLGSIFVAFIGAALLLLVLQALEGGSGRGRRGRY